MFDLIILSVDPAMSTKRTRLITNVIQTSLRRFDIAVFVGTAPSSTRNWPDREDELLWPRGVIIKFCNI